MHIEREDIENILQMGIDQAIDYINTSPEIQSQKVGDEGGDNNSTTVHLEESYTTPPRIFIGEGDYS
jgi:hypothetical protein